MALMTSISLENHCTIYTRGSEGQAGSNQWLLCCWRVRSHIMITPHTKAVKNYVNQFRIRDLDVYSAEGCYGVGNGFLCTLRDVNHFV